jgi:hypothetical protein
VKATIRYHLTSGRIVSEDAGLVEDTPAAEVRDAALRDIAQALLRGKSGQEELVPLLTVTDYQGRDHLIPTGHIQDIEIVLEATPPKS